MRAGDVAALAAEVNERVYRLLASRETRSCWWNPRRSGFPARMKTDNRKSRHNLTGAKGLHFLCN